MKIRNISNEVYNLAIITPSDPQVLVYCISLEKPGSKRLLRQHKHYNKRSGYTENGSFDVHSVKTIFSVSAIFKTLKVLVVMKL